MGGFSKVWKIPNFYFFFDGFPYYYHVFGWLIIVLRSLAPLKKFLCRWLWNGSQHIAKKDRDRPSLMKLFRQMVYVKTKTKRMQGIFSKTSDSIRVKEGLYNRTHLYEWKSDFIIGSGFMNGSIIFTFYSDE